MPSKNIKKGAILVARPSLNCDIFNRSVILIAEHHEDGSVGFILNKSLHLPASIFASNLKAEHIVFDGGPVDRENIYYLHNRPDLIKNSYHIVNDIYWSGDFEDLIEALNNNLIDFHEIKFYLGYSGWEKKQLEDEIERNDWELIDQHQIDIFQHWHNDLWVNCMKKLGGENLLWINTPSDPTLN